jgi:hypothetical protein
MGHGFLALRSIIRANVAARFEKDLQAYVALMHWLLAVAAARKYNRSRFIP